MALSLNFTEPRVDDLGRRYVIHKETGVKYLIREQDHAKGHVTSYSRVSSIVADPKPAAPKAPRAKQQAPSVDHFARATFIEGSEPT